MSSTGLQGKGCDRKVREVGTELRYFSRGGDACPGSVQGFENCVSADSARIGREWPGVPL